MEEDLPDTHFHFLESQTEGWVLVPLTRPSCSLSLKRERQASRLRSHPTLTLLELKERGWRLPMKPPLSLQGLDLQ